MVGLDMQENKFVKREKKPRYIEATKLETLCDIMADKCDDNGDSNWNQFRTAVECSPTVDVVEVVRCKDCRWGKEACGNIECFVDSNIPSEYHGYEWFCPNGERREGGND